MRRSLRAAATVLSLVWYLGIPTKAAAQATMGGEWRPDVEAAARQIVEAGLAPGIGIAVALGDWVAWTAGFGTADMESGRPVTEGTQFYIASSTKSLTATAAVLAAAKGDLDLQAPMVRYLPKAHLPDGVERESITVHDLLALTHGLSGDGPIVVRTAYTGEFTRDQLLDLLQYHRPTGNSGTFEYNNLGYNLVGMVLEVVYDESWKDVVHRLVLEPLGMTGTSAYRSRLDPDRLAMPHAYGRNGFESIPLYKRDENLHAAGGHFATAGDLARYLAAHQSGGRFEGRQVFPPGPIATTHQLQATQDRQFGPYHRFGWAYGWDLGTCGADTLIHRFGGFAGYRSHMSFMPQHGIGVVVLVNGDGPASPACDLLATYIYDRLLGKQDPKERFDAGLEELVRQAEQARQATAARLDERAARLAPLRHRLSAFTGTYESPILGRIEWREVAGGLEMRIGVLQNRAEVYDASADKLRVEFAGGGKVATFAFPEGEGPARAVTVSGVRFERVHP